MYAPHLSDLVDVVAEQLEMLKRSVEKVCEKSGDVNDIHEGLKKVGERVEEIGTVIGKMEERQDSMLKEIEVHPHL